MILTDYIARIKEIATSFTVIGGTPEFEKVITDTGNIGQLPFCFIVPLGERVIEDKKGTRTSFLIQETFATIVVVDNKVRHQDGKEYYPVDQIHALKQELFNAFIGWNPTDKKYHDTITFSGGRHLEMVESRIWHEFDWALSYYANEKRPPIVYPPVENVYVARFNVLQDDGDIPAEDYMKLAEDPGDIEGCI